MGLGTLTVVLELLMQLKTRWELMLRGKGDKRKSLTMIWETVDAYIDLFMF